MKLKNFNYIVSLIVISFTSHLFSEDKIDIWNNKEKANSENIQKEEKKFKKKIILGHHKP